MEIIINIIITLLVGTIICVYLEFMVRKDVKATQKSDPWQLHPDDEKAVKEFANKNPDPIVYSINHQNEVARKDNQKSIKSYHYSDFEQVQAEAATGKSYVNRYDYKSEGDR